MKLGLLLCVSVFVFCCDCLQNRDCLKHFIPPSMMKEMIHTCRVLERSLPKDTFISKRILSDLKTCSKRLNMADYQRLLDIYEEQVLEKLWSSSSNHTVKIFMDSFSHLKHFTDFCVTKVPQTLSPCARKKLKTLEATLKKPDHLYKAMSEFKNVLMWISFTMDKKKMQRRNQ